MITRLLSLISAPTLCLGLALMPIQQAHALDYGDDLYASDYTFDDSYEIATDDWSWDTGWSDDWSWGTDDGFGSDEGLYEDDSFGFGEDETYDDEGFGLYEDETEDDGWYSWSEEEEEQGFWDI